MAQKTTYTILGIYGRVQSFLAKAGPPRRRSLGNAYRLVLADRAGVALAEAAGKVESVSWRLSNVGRLIFSLPRASAQAQEHLLRYGNRVLVQFANGLPDWAGVIDPPREWSGDGQIRVNAYSGEYLLGWRQTDRGRYFSNASPGAIFTALVQEAAALEPLGVSVGSVAGATSTHSPDYHFANVLETIRDSVCGRLTGFEFDVTGALSAGRIVFQANLYARRGLDRPNVALIAGVNLGADSRLVEQGPIINWWDLAGAGDGWGPDRLVSQVHDDTSWGRYGLRQDARLYPDVSEQSTLDSHAAVKLAESKAPHNRLDLTALNLAPGRFGDYDLGDAVRVQAPGLGFGGYNRMVRVLSREYRPGDGTCRLVVQEWAA